MKKLLLLFFLVLSARASVPFAFWHPPQNTVASAPVDIILNPALLADGLVPSDSTLGNVAQTGLGNISQIKPGGGSGNITTMFINNFKTAPQFPRLFSSGGTIYNANTNRVFARTLDLNNEVAMEADFLGTPHQISFGFWVQSTTPFGTTTLSLDHFTAYTTAGESWVVPNVQVDNSRQAYLLDNHYQANGGTPTGKNVICSTTSNVWNYITCLADVTTGSANMMVYDANSNYLGSATGIISTNLSTFQDILIENLISYYGVGSGTNYLSSIVIGFDANANLPYGPLAADLGTPSITATQISNEVIQVNYTAAWAGTNGFDLSVSVNGGAFNTLTNGDLATVYLDNTVIYGDTYQYKVVAHLFGNSTTATSGSVSIPLLGPVPDIAGWKWNGDLTDWSGNSHTGSIVGSASPNFVTGQNGLANSAVTFNGSGQYITTGLNIPNTVTSGTITWWMKPSTAYTAAAERFFWGQSDGATSSGGAFSAEIYSDGNFYIGWRIFGSTDTRVSFAANSANYPLNTWINFAFTWSPSGSAVYTNGVLAGSNGTAANVTTTLGSFYIGEMPILAPSTSFPGVMDDLRIFTRVLTGTEITAIAANGSQ